MNVLLPVFRQQRSPTIPGATCDAIGPISISLAWMLGTNPHRPAFFPPLFIESPQASQHPYGLSRSTILTFNKNLRKNIMAQNTHMPAVNMGHGNVHSGNITSSFNSFNSYVYKSDEDAEMMRWLSLLELNNRHQSVRTDRFGGVGDWLLETNEYREWRSGEGGAENAVLFCSGNPGVGKTYLR